MSGLPLVSVIVSTHNRPDFLRKTIQSILSQTYPHLELIVISNGFSRANQEVVQEFEDMRIHYADQKNSGGPSSPRNHGIRLGKGVYVAFCDDDDLWMPDKLQKQVEILNNDASFGLCYTNMKRFDETKEWVEPKDSGRADLDSLLFINTVPLSSILIRKSILDQYGGFTESSIVGYSEDYDFILRYSSYIKLYHLNEFLVKYWSGVGRTSLKSDLFSAIHYIKYLKGMLGCYYLQYRQNRVGLKKLIRPMLTQIKIITKIILYNILKNLKIVGRQRK